MKKIKNELYFIGQTIRKERNFFSTTPFFILSHAFFHLSHVVIYYVKMSWVTLLSVRE